MFRIYIKGERRALTVVDIETRGPKCIDVFFLVYDSDAPRFGMDCWRWVLADNSVVLLEEGEEV